MTALALIMTTAGQERFTAAQVDDDIDLTISSVGLTASTFIAAPTLTALPGKFKDVATISGDQVGDNVIHLTIRDDAEETYTVLGFGLFLADGTLFAVYSQPTPIFEKAAPASMLIAIDLAFPTADVTAITFGNTNFLYPPATTTRQGVVELATPTETIAGTDTSRAVTPKGLDAIHGVITGETAAAIGVLHATVTGETAEAINDLHTEVSGEISALIHIGTVWMWYGSSDSVPAGWAICNGQIVARSDGAGNITTPDLRDRVVVGAGAHAMGDAFGAWEKTLNTEDAGAHDHSVELPDHQHAAGTLAVTVETAQTGTTFTYSVKGDAASGGSGKVLAVPPDGNAPEPPGITDPGHDHDATIAGSTASAGAATVDTSEAASHAHSLTVDVTQPSFALHFIMKV